MGDFSVDASWFRKPGVRLGPALDGAGLTSARPQGDEIAGDDFDQALAELDGLPFRPGQPHGPVKTAGGIHGSLEADALARDVGVKRGQKRGQSYKL